MSKVIFDWECPKCKSKDVLFWQSKSVAINGYGECVKSMWIDDLFYQCLECDEEWY